MGNCLFQSKSIPVFHFKSIPINLIMQSILISFCGTAKGNQNAFSCVLLFLSSYSHHFLSFFYPIGFSIHGKHSVNHVPQVVFFHFIFATKKYMWNQKEFESVYDRYKLSGLPVKDFCINEGIYQSRFYYWQKKLKDQQQEADQPSGFVPIIFNKPQTPINNTIYGGKTLREKLQPCGDVIEIVYPNGVTVRISCTADIKQLQSLILLNQNSHV
ncbi:MAG: hypothetical protein GX833_09775 [Clostridium sp.]|nr:hypothetical protein [Clostridium sp.]